jgi:hypothetical protein
MYSIHRIREETYLGDLGHMEKDEAEVHLILENEEVEAELILGNEQNGGPVNRRSRNPANPGE